MYNHDDPTKSERLDAELALLTAMYPDSVTFDLIKSELDFRPPDHPKAQLLLRLPARYPEEGKPDVLLACDSFKNDLRTAIIQQLYNFQTNEQEILDTLLQKFLDLLNTSLSNSDLNSPQPSLEPPPVFKTVVIWLHHLLAPSKRSRAIHPSSSNSICGLTKPGYPGVMIFTGPRDAVNEHVTELKNLRWQAFQTRFEDDELWQIGNGPDSVKEITEVESMADLVKNIPDERREGFLKVIGVK